MSKTETGPIAADLAKAAEGSQDAMQRVAAATPAWNATLRTTCVATQPGGRTRHERSSALAADEVNCRVLPADSIEYVQSTLKKVVSDDQVIIKMVGEASMGPASPMRPDLLNAATRVTNQLWPGVPVVPTW